VSGKWETSNSHSARYYDVPVSTIDSYGPHPNGKNCRPRDDNCGDRMNVFLDLSDSKRGGRLQPSGVVPVFHNAVHPEANPDTVLCDYWWFFPYNDAPGVGGHEGDWEHITVRVGADGNLEGIEMAAHLTSSLSTDPEFRNGRLVVYSALGSHASFAKSGTHDIDDWPWDDHCAAGGYAWETWRNLKPLSEQPWKNFAGAWGEVGMVSHTTGPLGPWHKRTMGDPYVPITDRRELVAEWWVHAG
jgi:hypothetical protein